MSDTKVKNHFETWADRFDGLYKFENQSVFRKYFNKIFRKALYERVNLTFEAIGDLEGKTVLDVGCGSGRQLIYAVETGARKATGIDFSKDMLELAKQYAHEIGISGKIELFEGDFLEYPFPGTFDFTYALGVFDYVDKPVEMLRKMRAVTNESVIATFPAPTLIRMPLRKLRYALRGCPVYFFSKKELTRIVEAAGYTHYQIKEFASCGLIFHGEVR